MPFIKCPECGKVNSIKLKNCPKCEAPLDSARAAYYNTQSTQAHQSEPAQQPSWGQAPQQPQNNPWGQPQTPPRPQDNPWTQQQQPQGSPWGQPQATPRPQDNPWTQQQQPQGNPWGQPAQSAPSQQPATTCPSCGAHLQNGTRYCPACGAPVPPPAPGIAGIPTRKNPYSL